MVVSETPEQKLRKVDAMNRYAMDTVSAKLLKETGRRAAMRLFELLGNEEQWQSLGPRNQLAALDLALNRAFGRVETVSAETKLTESTNEVAGALPTHLRALAGKLALPELQGAKSAKKED